MPNSEINALTLGGVGSGTIIEKAVRKGRIAVFADTGLGKTLMQLSIAKNIVNETNQRVLILTPLAVGFQFVQEAEKLGIEDVYQTIKGELKGKIIICNYERLHYLNSNDFIGCILCRWKQVLCSF